MYREQRSTKPFLVVKEARKQKAHEEAMALAAGLPVPGESDSKREREEGRGGEARQTGRQADREHRVSRRGGKGGASKREKNEKRLLQ